MDQIGDYSEEFEAVTNDAVFDVSQEKNNPLNEFATDITMTEVERIEEYAFSSILLRRYTFIKNIERCCKRGEFEEIYELIVPVLGRLVADRDNSIRIVALNQFQHVAKLCFENDYDKGVEMMDSIMLPILANTLVESSEDIQKVSLEAFVKCCSYFKREDQGIHTYLFILKFVQDPSKDRRIIACYLFHDAAPILGSEILSQCGISELIILAEDPYCQVRKHAILALGPVSDILDPYIVESCIYSCLLRNTQSPSWVVRRACAIVIPEVFRNIKSHKYFLTITKTIGELFRDESKWVKNAMLQSLGQLIAVIPSDFNINDDLKTRYHQLGNPKDDVATNLFSRCCAFYFPAVLRSMSKSNGFWNDMQDLYSRLSRHNDPIVRRSLSYSLHEVAEIIGTKNTEKSLINIQTHFLVDKEDIQIGVIQNMAKFWKILSPETRIVQANSLMNIVNRFEENRFWRQRCEMSVLLNEFTTLLDARMILETVAPVYMKLIVDPVEVIRETTAKSTCCVLKKAIEADQKRGMTYFFKIIALAKSIKYNIRETFIMCIPQLGVLLARKSFKLLIRPVILILAQDKVPCIRQSIVAILVSENDKRMLQLYGMKKVIGLLQNDSDREVLGMMDRCVVTRDVLKRCQQIEEEKKKKKKEEKEEKEAKEMKEQEKEQEENKSIPEADSEERMSVSPLLIERLAIETVLSKYQVSPFTL